MIHSRPSAPMPPCQIPHHHPGRHVTWNQWDAEQQQNVHMRGVVEWHRSDIRYAVIKTDTGGYVRMSCGPLNPLRVTR